MDTDYKVVPAVSMGCKLMIGVSGRQVTAATQDLRDSKTGGTNKRRPGLLVLQCLLFFGRATISIDKGLFFLFL